jgi:hypothetical protein
MNQKIKAIGIFPDESVHIIKQFGGHGCRFDKSVLFLDNLEDFKESLNAFSSLACEQYLAVEMCEENRDLIKKIAEYYEPKT